MLDRAAAGWRGIAYTPADVRRLQTIRRDLTRRNEHRPDDTTGGDVTAAA